MIIARPEVCPNNETAFIVPMGHKSAISEKQMVVVLDKTDDTTYNFCVVSVIEKLLCDINEFEAFLMLQCRADIAKKILVQRFGLSSESSIKIVLLAPRSKAITKDEVNELLREIYS